MVYGKGSLIRKMPGDDWQKFANLRALFGYMYGQPAKKLLFMGGEFGQWNEWDHENSLDWHLLKNPLHAGLKNWVTDLNRFYREEPALHELDFDPAGFEWVDCNDADNSVISFLRKGQSTSSMVLVICNLTPVPRENYRVGAPRGGHWEEVLNSDSSYYAGSGMGNSGGLSAVPAPFHGRPHSLRMTLPPLSVVFLRSKE